MKPLLALLCLAALLTACNDNMSSEPTEQDSAAQSPVAAKAVVTAEHELQADEVKVALAPTASAGESQEKPQKKLDLSLPADLTDPTAGDQLPEEGRLLLNMFAKQEKRIHVSGGVHRDEENPDMLRSINGAEVSLEIKLD